MNDREERRQMSAKQTTTTTEQMVESAGKRSLPKKQEQLRSHRLKKKTI